MPVAAPADKRFRRAHVTPKGRRAWRRPSWWTLGRLLIVLGAVAVLAGGALLFADRIPWLGRLPGDFVVRRGPVTIYFPVATAIVVSLVLTVVLNLFWRR